MNHVLLPRPVPLLQQPSRRNDCGPHAAAMAIGFYYPSAAQPLAVARQMRLLRVPLLGATLPWAIPVAMSVYGLHAVGGWFTRFRKLREYVRLGWPVIVVVRPSDFPRCPWYALHYRVVVGYRDDPALPGGGALLFNCSSCPAAPDRADPGNLTLDYATFRRQWRTYLTWQWAVAVTPR